ncbi:MAG: hypothetical protein R3266_00890 [Gemmatimonadota bacterium]|nr:hypothetical protein [Gemmatimonadota bacterium]
MNDFKNLPELYTQREVDRTRRRQRNLGRLEGAGVMLGIGFLWSLIGSWIPTALVLAVVGYVVWKLVSKPKRPDEET